MPLQSGETVSLTAARHRVLQHPVDAPINMPPFAASAMDGYAVQVNDLNTDQPTTLRVIGTSWAGQPFDGPLAPGEAVRIFTGAAVPAGADQVLLQEETATAAGDSVTFNPHQPSETYIRPIGHDVNQGQRLLNPGTLLNQFHLGMLSASGVGNVTVASKPVVGVFSTGDELVDPGTSPKLLKPGQIYDSNRLTVLSLLQDLPFHLHDLGRLPDNEDAVDQAIRTHAAQCNALITSGGVSVGDADFVTSTIARLGQLKFWKLNLKPGKPLAYGQIDRADHRCHIFGLPGNPVSTIVTLLLVARPALLHLAGVTDSGALSPIAVPATLDGNIKHSPGRAEYQRGTMRTSASGLVVSHTGDQSSNRLSTFANANCLIEVPKTSADIASGSQVLVLPFKGLV